MTLQLKALTVVLTLLFALAVMAPGVHRAKAGPGLSIDQASAVICSYPWPCSEALAIAFRESRFDPHAYNAGCGCAGLFQIADVHGHSLSTRFDPEANTAIAYGLWETQGWAPWRME